MKTVVLFSGGMDSATLLHYVVDTSDVVVALSFDYGQRHSVELKYAESYAKDLGVPHQTLDISSLYKIIGGSSQTNPSIEVPHGHFEDESMKLTVVPNRNMIMLSIAIGYAASRGFDSVAYAAHSGDHAIYRDCRPEFVKAIATVAYLANWQPIEILAPFLDVDKGIIYRLGVKLGVDFDKTWTCYDPQNPSGAKFVPCGLCGACVERKEAMSK